MFLRILLQTMLTCIMNFFAATKKQSYNKQCSGEISAQDSLIGYKLLSDYILIKESSQQC